jgi:Fe-S-cluster containining protein
MTTTLTTATCRRCGSCCLQGGPALHRADLALIENGIIPLERLITIRKGELADNPVAGGVRATRVELVKIAGSGRDWRCCYYDEAARGCRIYGQRPQACAVLQCWDTAAILAMVETDVLSRLDIVAVDDPLRPLIMAHERECPCPDLEWLGREIALLAEGERVALQDLAARDLAFRDRVVRQLGLSLGLELFAFVRPIFQLLQPLGVRVGRTAGGLVLQWP